MPLVCAFQTQIFCWIHAQTVFGTSVFFSLERVTIKVTKDEMDVILQIWNIHLLIGKFQVIIKYLNHPDNELDASKLRAYDEKVQEYEAVYTFKNEQTVKYL